MFYAKENMNVKVVYAHPIRESFNAALHKNIIAGLRSAGHEIRDFDLYARGFDPVMPSEELRNYADVEKNRIPVQEYVDGLLWAEALVLCFPTWWNGMPAILKGYFDRVWVPGVVFHISQTGLSNLVPQLRNLTHLSIVTTCGSPWWFTKVYMGNPNHRVLMNGIQAVCPQRLKKTFLAHYSMGRCSAQSRTRFLEKVRKHFSRFGG
jgi:NAD(P)H dehydrogenase (quinone)